MVNMTGTNLTGIMETMKFAFHAAMSKDLLELEEKISRVNITYAIIPSQGVIKIFTWEIAIIRSNHSCLCMK